MGRASAHQTPHPRNRPGRGTGSASRRKSHFARGARKTHPPFPYHEKISVRACRGTQICVCGSPGDALRRTHRMVRQTTHTAQVLSLHLAMAARGDALVEEYDALSLKRLIVPLPKLPEIA